MSAESDNLTRESLGHLGTTLHSIYRAVEASSQAIAQIEKRVAKIEEGLDKGGYIRKRNRDHISEEDEILPKRFKDSRPAMNTQDTRGNELLSDHLSFEKIRIASLPLGQLLSLSTQTGGHRFYYDSMHCTRCSFLAS